MINRNGVDRRDFMRILGGTAAAAGLSLPPAACGGGSSTDRKVIVLGLDGLDPKLVRALMEMGRLPNFKKLAEMGSFQALGTTMPALSPVAWSSFITGMTPGGHGIADFIARNPLTYTPEFAIYQNTDPDLTISVGDVHLPIKGGGPVNNRQGKPFWAYLTERDIPAWISKIPTNFPVEETATHAIAGMGTPDLVDSYGVFTYYTSDVFEDFPNLEGGEVLYVDVNKNVVRSNILGPVNTLKTPKDTSSDPYANTAKIPFTAYIDPKADGARIDIQGQSILLKRGQYSPWVTLTFDLLPVIGSVQGIARFLLKGVAPHFQLYVTPINIDPSAQAAPVTYPAEFGAEIARDIGAFWTKGLPSDMKAFDHKVINDEEYVGQAELILNERMALFDHQWSRFESGLFYFYVSSTDQDAHMLWRNMDETHPKHNESDVRFAGWIPHLYEEMDKLVGKVLPAVDDKTLLLICSDHGFTQFARQFHLNTWLRDNGYLVLNDKAAKKEETSIFDVDWSQSVAYGVGFNGLYLNLQGREGEGIVPPQKAGEITAKLARELEAVVDPETGQHPIAKVYRREDMYIGPATPMMPELLVGYTPGYRNASASVLGSTGKPTIDLNPWAWSGDHSMARDLVPGTLMSSKKVARANTSILDLPVTVLDFFGIEKPEQMVGSSIFRAG
ncbi:MAG: alkaline phosphatase family protein [Acidobacteria bacterium]|jgi:predicted AlkP superfamily phosphohydrolase/phosphomutase|nr:alkaline phosphatase family protein [Acidobacteriota bacterium]